MARGSPTDFRPRPVVCVARGVLHLLPRAGAALLPVAAGAGLRALPIRATPPAGGLVGVLVGGLRLFVGVATARRARLEVAAEVLLVAVELRAAARADLLDVNVGPAHRVAHGLGALVDVLADNDFLDDARFLGHDRN